MKTRKTQLALLCATLSVAPLSFSAVQGEFQSGGQGGGEMDKGYVNNYPYSRCSEENVPAEDCKQFGYVYGKEALPFGDFVKLVMNTSAEQYRADMVSDNYNIPDNAQWMLPNIENLRYAESKGMLEGNNLYPVFIDNGAGDSFVSEDEIQLTYRAGATVPEEITDDTQIVGLMAAYSFDSNGRIIAGTPGEINSDNGKVIILDPTPDPTPKPDPDPEPEPEPEPIDPTPERIYASVGIYEAMTKREAKLYVKMSRSEWEDAGKPTSVTFKWYYGTEARFNTDSGYKIDEQNQHVWAITTGRFKKGKSFCFEAFTFDSTTKPDTEQFYRNNPINTGSICDGSSDGISSWTDFWLISNSLSASDPNHPSKWWETNNNQ
ncbi:hypothetical protein [Vibrio sp. RE86]|uniref:hypothetical protein n=1 Tax=Vibrio sp. RE86 TaxID=2607605 RepID=UPI0014933E74|nr:hypothetical protein [Vibrio sp. RE86]